MKILYIPFKPTNIVKNSTKLKLAIPADTNDGDIYSNTMITLESNSIRTTNITKVLDAIVFNAKNKEYIDISANTKIGIIPTIQIFSLCMWLNIKNENGENNAIFEYFHNDGDKKKIKNKLSIKTGSTSNTLVFAIDNISVIKEKIPNDTWFHLCWILEHVSDEVNFQLGTWTIYINGDKESMNNLSNKLYLNTYLQNDRILLGKSIDNDINYFNGSIAEISIYDKAIDPILDIYSNDLTVKYLIEGFENSSETSNENNIGIDYDLYKYSNKFNNEDDPSSYSTTISELSNRDFHITVGKNTIPQQMESDSNEQFHTGINYENMSLGIFFIAMSIVIYRYFK